MKIDKVIISTEGIPSKIAEMAIVTADICMVSEIELTFWFSFSKFLISYNLEFS